MADFSKQDRTSVSTTTEQAQLPPPLEVFRDVIVPEIRAYAKLAGETVVVGTTAASIYSSTTLPELQQRIIALKQQNLLTDKLKQEIFEKVTQALVTAGKEDVALRVCEYADEYIGSSLNVGTERAKILSSLYHSNDPAKATRIISDFPSGFDKDDLITEYCALYISDRREKEIPALLKSLTVDGFDKPFIVSRIARDLAKSRGIDAALQFSDDLKSNDTQKAQVVAELAGFAMEQGDLTQARTLLANIPKDVYLPGMSYLVSDVSKHLGRDEAINLIEAHTKSKREASECYQAVISELVSNSKTDQAIACATGLKDHSAELLRETIPVALARNHGIAKALEYVDSRTEMSESDKEIACAAIVIDGSYVISGDRAGVDQILQTRIKSTDLRDLAIEKLIEAGNTPYDRKVELYRKIEGTAPKAEALEALIDRDDKGENFQLCLEFAKALPNVGTVTAEVYAKLAIGLIERNQFTKLEQLWEQDIPESAKGAAGDRIIDQLLRKGELARAQEFIKKIPSEAQRFPVVGLANYLAENRSAEEALDFIENNYSNHPAFSDMQTTVIENLLRNKGSEDLARRLERKTADRNEYAKFAARLISCGGSEIVQEITNRVGKTPEEHDQLTLEIVRVLGATLYYGDAWKLVENGFSSDSARNEAAQYLSIVGKRYRGDTSEGPETIRALQNAKEIVALLKGRSDTELAKSDEGTKAKILDALYDVSLINPSFDGPEFKDWTFHRDLFEQTWRVVRTLGVNEQIALADQTAKDTIVTQLRNSSEFSKNYEAGSRRQQQRDKMFSNVVTPEDLKEREVMSKEILDNVAQAYGINDLPKIDFTNQLEAQAAGIYWGDKIRIRLDMINPSLYCDAILHELRHWVQDHLERGDAAAFGGALKDEASRYAKMLEISELVYSNRVKDKYYADSVKERDAREFATEILNKGTSATSRPLS